MSKKNSEKRKTKKIPMTPEMREVFEKQFEAFRKKFNREPGPDDPVFFDPDADTPQMLSEASMEEMFDELLTLAREADVTPALIYAIQKTGRIITQENMHLLSEEELEEWNAAIEEYRSLN